MSKKKKITSTIDPINDSQTLSRREIILSELRNRIISGDLGPGKQLPRRFELMEHFGAASQTVQDALSRLQEDGFINAQPRRGTFVSKLPPHLFRYGFCQPQPVTNHVESLLYSSLHSAAIGLEEVSKIDVSFYEILSEPIKNSEMSRFARDIENQCLAGIIFFCPPFTLAENGLLEKIQIPTVAIVEKPAYGIPAVYPDIDRGIEMAVERLHQLGRRRISVILALSYEGGPEGPNWLKKYSFPSHFVHRVGPFDSFAIRHILHLLMRSPAEERPDGLIVVDDNMDEAVCVGLSESGIRVPNDIDVVALCNYPNQSSPILPILRLCYDSHLIVKRCLEKIEMQRNNAHPPMLSLMPPHFEDELSDSVKPFDL